MEDAEHTALRQPIESWGDKATNQPLSRKEKQSWLLYDFAQSVYSLVGISGFIPVLTTALADEQAWRNVGLSTPETCDASKGILYDCRKCIEGEGTKFFPSANASIITDPPVSIGSLSIDPVAFTTYGAFKSACISFSVLAQAVLFLTTSAAADYGTLRKRLLLVVTVIGAASTMAFVLMIDPSAWWLAGILLIISNVCFGASQVYYNAFLPLLVDADSRANSPDKRDAVANELSNQGYAMGYLGGVILIFVALGITVGMGGSLASVRVSLVLTGIWWLGLGGLAISGLKARPGPPRPEGKSIVSLSSAALGTAWRQRKEYSEAFSFLLVYFVFSDGYSTISVVGVLFAQQELCMNSGEIAALLVEVPLMAMAGNMFFLWLQRRLGWSGKAMLELLLGLCALLPVYGMIGFLTPPDGIGIKHKEEIYIFGALFGWTVGAAQSYARTVFADLIPKGAEGTYFGVYEITDKGSSWIGPMVVAIVSSITGRIRGAMVYLFFAMVFPVWALHRFVDMDLGRAQSGRLTRVEVELESTQDPL